MLAQRVDLVLVLGLNGTRIFAKDVTTKEKSRLTWVLFAKTGTVTKELAADAMSHLNNLGPFITAFVVCLKGIFVVISTILTLGMTLV